MSRVSAALFPKLLRTGLLLSGLLAACTPASQPQRVYVDSYYTSTVNGQAASYNGRGWVVESPTYTLRYWLGTHNEGSAPGSVKLELRTTDTVRIGWSGSRFVYGSGEKSAVTHEGVPYGYSPTDTDVAPQQRLRDRVVPQNNLVFRGERVVGFRYLVEPDAFGTDKFGLELVLNGEPLDIRFDGTRQPKKPTG